MINSNAFNYINMLNKAADASWLRNEVITNNIANVDTPGYKRKEVAFDTHLLAAMTRKSEVDRQHQGKVRNLYPSIYTDSASFSYRLDGNNVNIDTESSQLAQNQIRYYTLIDSMNQEFSRIKTVLNSK